MFLRIYPISHKYSCRSLFLEWFGQCSTFRHIMAYGIQIFLSGNECIERHRMIPRIRIRTSRRKCATCSMVINIILLGYFSRNELNESFDFGSCLSLNCRSYPSLVDEHDESLSLSAILLKVRNYLFVVDFIILECMRKLIDGGVQSSTQV